MKDTPYNGCYSGSPRSPVTSLTYEPYQVITDDYLRLGQLRQLQTIQAHSTQFLLNAVCKPKAKTLYDKLNDEIKEWCGGILEEY